MIAVAVYALLSGQPNARSMTARTSGVNSSTGAYRGPPDSQEPRRYLRPGLQHGRVAHVVGRLDALTRPAFHVTIGDMNVAARPYRMTARAEAVRETGNRVLAVAVELFTERPYEEVSLEEVAERAQVTKRTLLRRFASKEELFVTAMNGAAEEEMRRRDDAPIGDIVGAVANVVDHYERFGDNRLRLLAQEDRIDVVADDVAMGREHHRAWVERTFAPLISRWRGVAKKRRVAALVALTDVYTWKLLRRDLALSRRDTERTLVELIEHLKGDS